MKKLSITTLVLFGFLSANQKYKTKSFHKRQNTSHINPEQHSKNSIALQRAIIKYEGTFVSPSLLTYFTTVINELLESSNPIIDKNLAIPLALCFKGMNYSLQRELSIKGRDTLQELAERVKILQNRLSEYIQDHETPTIDQLEQMHQDLLPHLTSLSHDDLEKLSYVVFYLIGRKQILPKDGVHYKTLVPRAKILIASKPLTKQS